MRLTWYCICKFFGVRTANDFPFLTFVFFSSVRSDSSDFLEAFRTWSVADISAVTVNQSFFLSFGLSSSIFSVFFLVSSPYNMQRSWIGLSWYCMAFPERAFFKPLHCFRVRLLNQIFQECAVGYKVVADMFCVCCTFQSWMLTVCSSVIFWDVCFWAIHIHDAVSQSIDAGFAWPNCHCCRWCRLGLKENCFCLLTWLKIRMLSPLSDNI